MDSIGQHGRLIAGAARRTPSRAAGLTEAQGAGYVSRLPIKKIQGWIPAKEVKKNEIALAGEKRRTQAQVNAHTQALAEVKKRAMAEKKTRSRALAEEREA